MRFAYWAREIAGWGLLVLALWIFLNSYRLMLSKQWFTGAPTLVVGFLIFRGGIHLLKVAVAAQAARSLSDAPAPPVRRMPRLSATPAGPTPPAAVRPGPKAGRPAARS
jgi:hypothetical protein